MPAWIPKAVPIALLVTAIVLMALILIQSKGSGLSGVFGGEGNVYRTKRGAEKIVFYATIIVAVLFFAIALLNAKV